MITVRSVEFGVLLPLIYCACLRRYHNLCYSSPREKRGLEIRRITETCLSMPIADP